MLGELFNEYLNPLQKIDDSEVNSKAIKLAIGAATLATLYNAGKYGVKRYGPGRDEKQEKKTKSYIQARFPTLDMPKQAAADDKNYTLMQYFAGNAGGTAKPLKDILGILVAATVAKRMSDKVFSSAERDKADKELENTKREYFDVYKKGLLSKTAAGEEKRGILREIWDRGRGNMPKAEDNLDVFKLPTLLSTLYVLLSGSVGFVSGKKLGDLTSENRLKLKQIRNIAKNRARLADAPVLLNPSDFDEAAIVDNSAEKRHKNNPLKSVEI